MSLGVAGALVAGALVAGRTAAAGLGAEPGRPGRWPRRLGWGESYRPEEHAPPL